MEPSEQPADADAAVRTLIEHFASAVRELNSGAPMSAEHRAALERELGLTSRRKRGRPKCPRAAARELDIARRMRAQYEAAQVQAEEADNAPPPEQPASPPRLRLASPATAADLERRARETEDLCRKIGL